MKINRSIVIGTITLLSACAGTPMDKEENLPFKVLGEASKKMPPAKKFSAHPVGTIRALFKSDTQGVSNLVTEVNGDIVHSEIGSCKRRRSLAHLYWPQLEFWGCGSDKAKHTYNDVSIESGSIWPLTVGNQWKVSWKGRNNKGSTWRNSAKCNVPETVRISTSSQEMDAFKVVCNFRSLDNTNRYKRVSYFAPEANYYIAHASYKNGQIDWARGLDEIRYP